jgi:hypothetical protein
MIWSSWLREQSALLRGEQCGETGGKQYELTHSDGQFSGANALIREPDAEAS